LRIYTKKADIFFKNTRINNGVKERCCTKCNIWKPETEEYYYMSNKKKPEKGFHAECKECTKKRSLNNRNKNINRARKSWQDWYRADNNKIKIKEYNKEYYEENPERKLNTSKEFRKNNPDKVAIYNKNRNEHKKHEITKKEWITCKNYFSNCCAYCGLSITEHYRMYDGKPQKIDLHKEHMIHDGKNDLSNCIPSCQECNSEKNVFSFDTWYNKDNPKYTEERYNKIINWITKDYKKYIEVKQNKRDKTEAS